MHYKNGRPAQNGDIIVHTERYGHPSTADGTNFNTGTARISTERETNDMLSFKRMEDIKFRKWREAEAQ